MESVLMCCCKVRQRDHSVLCLCLGHSRMSRGMFKKHMDQPQNLASETKWYRESLETCQRDKQEKKRNEGRTKENNMNKERRTYTNDETKT